MNTDRQSLLRLMAHTMSDDDDIALLALRKANKILKASKMGWEDVFGADPHEASSLPPQWQRPPTQHDYADAARYSQPPLSAQRMVPYDPKRVADAFREVEQDEVMMMLKFVKHNAGPRFNYKFIDGVLASYSRTGKLIGRQRSTLEKIYNSVYDQVEKRR